MREELTSLTIRGAVDACNQAGTGEVLKWDMAETAKGGPFDEIVDSDMYGTTPSTILPALQVLALTPD